MSYHFLPPRPAPAVQAAVDLIHPLAIRLRDRVARIDLDAGSEARLRALRGRPALLLPNHPSESEPPVMGGVARRLGEPFYYLATHELFDGPAGWLARRLGAFSVRRGWPDRAALRTCVAVLADRGGKLVLFPEGETHMRSDLILPLNPGAAYVALSALARMEARGATAEGVLPVVPVTVRYRYLSGHVWPELSRGLSRLERALGLPDGAGGEPAARVRRVGVRVLAGVEREYGLPDVAGLPVDDRIARLYAHIEGRVTRVMGVPTPRGEGVAPRMRALFNRAFDYRDGLEAGATSYERALHRRRLRAAGAVLADLWRVQNFMAVGEDMIAGAEGLGGAPAVTAERVGELLFRLEKEVYGRPRTRPLRAAAVRAGEPLDLSPLLPAFRASRRAAVREATARIEGRLRAQLDVMRDEDG